MPVDNSFNLRPSDGAKAQLFAFNTRQILTYFINLLDPNKNDADIVLRLANIDNKLAEIARDLENPEPAIVDILKDVLATPPPTKGSKAADLLMRLINLENNSMPNLNLQQETLQKTLNALVLQFNGLAKPQSVVDLGKILTLKNEIQKFNESKVQAFKELKTGIHTSISQIQNETTLSTGKAVPLPDPESSRPNMKPQGGG